MTVQKGSAYYGACSGFADSIYTRMGLPTLRLNWDQGTPDDKPGALRFFKDWNGPALFTPPFGTGDANHVAIQDGNQQIDANWNNDGAGATVRSFDYGCGVPANPWTLANYWNNAISRAPYDAANNQSLLKSLDQE